MKMSTIFVRAGLMSWLIYSAIIAAIWITCYYVDPHRHEIPFREVAIVIAIFILAGLFVIIVFLGVIYAAYFEGMTLPEEFVKTKKPKNKLRGKQNENNGRLKLNR